VTYNWVIFEPKWTWFWRQISAKLPMIGGGLDPPKEGPKTGFWTPKTGFGPPKSHFWGRFSWFSEKNRVLREIPHQNPPKRVRRTPKPDRTPGKRENGVILLGIYSRKIPKLPGSFRKKTPPRRFSWGFSTPPGGEMGVPGPHFPLDLKGFLREIPHQNVPVIKRTLQHCLAPKWYCPF
jgi:hypothetical protein